MIFRDLKIIYHNAGGSRINFTDQFAATSALVEIIIEPHIYPTNYDYSLEMIYTSTSKFS